MVKIDVYLRKVSQNYNRGSAFLEHPVQRYSQAVFMGSFGKN